MIGPARGRRPGALFRRAARHHDPASKGKKIASPQTGGTQDIALRTLPSEARPETTCQGAKDTTIIAEENSQTLELFLAGSIDGAWRPEPWASRLVLEGGGKVLVDEKTLWPQGKFVTTHLIVRTAYPTSTLAR